MVSSFLLTFLFLFSCFLLLGLVLSIFSDLKEEVPFFLRNIYLFGSFLLSTGFAFLNFFGYFFMSYDFREDSIRVRGGIIWKSDKNIPYHKLTDATLNQGPIQRMFGFADIHLQTAGSSGVEAMLCGINGADNIQEKIRQKIKEFSLKTSDDGEENVFVEMLKVLRSIDSKLKN